MNSIEGTLQSVEHLCEKRHVRLTLRRKQVLAGLIQSNKALSAYDLIDFCKLHHGETIPAMSVYRILAFLEKKELVHKLKLVNKFVACTHINCTHEHRILQFFICIQCSRVKEIMMQPSSIIDLQSSAQEAEFQLLTPQLEINGVCNNCTTVN
jgi:Fur family zinc uptake transcriptional regulator